MTQYQEAIVFGFKTYPVIKQIVHVSIEMFR